MAEAASVSKLLMSRRSALQESRCIRYTSGTQVWLGKETDLLSRKLACLQQVSLMVAEPPLLCLYKEVLHECCRLDTLHLQHTKESSHRACLNVALNMFVPLCLLVIAPLSQVRLAQLSVLQPKFNGVSL